MISTLSKRLLPLLSVCLIIATSCAAQMESRGRIGAGAGYETAELTVAGRARRYIVVAPPGQRERAPVVIALHGGGGSAESMIRMTRIVPLARRNGFIAVFPQGLGRRDGAGTWNAGGCCAYAARENVDDIAFLNALIDRLIDQHNADPARVYLTGFSNGGMMTHAFAAAAPEKIAAMGVVSGAVFDDAPAPKGPVPAMLIHGKADRAVPFSGGQSGMRLVRNAQLAPYSSFPESVERWLAANGCAGEAVETVDATVTRSVYAHCASGAPVETYVIEDGAHAWPGGEKGREAADEPSTALSASEVLWAFFEKHAR